MVEWKTENREVEKVVLLMPLLKHHDTPTLTLVTTSVTKSKFVGRSDKFGCAGVPFLERVDLSRQASSDEPADRQILKTVFTVLGFLQEIVH